jgi:membrane fusion protein (multidrug efflux system)
MLFKENNSLIVKSILLITSFLMIQACSSGSSKEVNSKSKPLALPVWQVDTSSAVTVKDYLGTIEGKVNVEIRPQVEGLLDDIYVDEGDYVVAGQKLFKINASAYQEVLNNMLATENVAKAKLENAHLEVERLRPLVENEVISEVRLKSAQSDYAVAKASLEQASAAVRSATINKEFTQINAPVNGFIGRIPKRIGNLVMKNDDQPLTVLSDVQEVYVYFSMSESDFLYFSKNKAKADSIAGITRDHNSKLVFPDVSLIMADGTLFPHKGVVDAVNGQVNRTTGAISLRASFRNEGNILRTGSTGTLKVEERKSGVIQIPQVSTTELQDRTMVYLLNQENKVLRQAVTIVGKSGSNYIIGSGLKPGDRILVSGFDKISEGTIITPIAH